MLFLLYMVEKLLQIILYVSRIFGSNFKVAIFPISIWIEQLVNKSFIVQPNDKIYDELLTFTRNKIIALQYGSVRTLN